MSAAPALSVVIPVFNEEDNLAPLTAELLPVLEKTGLTHEVLYVDDCSTDKSLDVLRRLKAQHPVIRILRHRLNQGESAAEATGFHHARGEIVITLDADQQNDPADIPAFLAKLVPGVDCVCGVRPKRIDSWSKRVSSKIANGWRQAMTGDRDLTDAGCTYRAIRRAALAELPVFNGMHRFLPTMLRYQGYGVTEVLTHHRPRTRGYSKYGIGNRLWRGLRDCMAMTWLRARALRGDRFGGEE